MKNTKLVLVFAVLFITQSVFAFTVNPGFTSSKGGSSSKAASGSVIRSDYFDFNCAFQSTEAKNKSSSKKKSGGMDFLSSLKGIFK